MALVKPIIINTPLITSNLMIETSATQTSKTAHHQIALLALNSLIHT